MSGEGSYDALLPCVAGNGLWCADTGWVAPASAFPAPLVSVARRDSDEGWVVVDELGGMHTLVKGAYLEIADGVRAYQSPPRIEIRAVNVGVPLARVVATTEYYNDPGWAAVTKSGELVLGWKGAATVCAGLPVDQLASAPVGLLGFHDGKERNIASSSCEDFELPPAAVGSGRIGCGIVSAPFAFDAHTIYAPAMISCARDRRRAA